MTERLLRVNLPAPYETTWLDLYEDPPMGAWLDLAESADAAIRHPALEEIEKVCLNLRPLIAAHNLTDHEGNPIEIALRALSIAQFKAIRDAVLTALGQAADDSPLVPSKAPSRGRSSRKSPSPSASLSTV